MSNKQELAKIAREIKEIKAQLGEPSMDEVLLQEWTELPEGKKKSILVSLGKDISQKIHMMGYPKFNFNIISYNELYGTTSSYGPFALSYQFGSEGYLVLYPFPSIYGPAGVEIGGEFTAMKTYSGNVLSQIKGFNREVSSWVAETLAE